MNVDLGISNIVLSVVLLSSSFFMLFPDAKKATGVWRIITLTCAILALVGGIIFFLLALGQFFNLRVPPICQILGSC